MRPTRRRPARRVLFAEALRRIGRQTTRQRLRSVRYIIRLAFDEARFLLTTALPLLPRALVAVHARTRILLPGCAFDLYGTDQPGPLVLFVHGGAWGAGSSTQHAILGDAMSTALGSPVAVADQRVYPAGGMREQAGDVADVARAARARFPGRRVVAVGHSSGAHSLAIALAEGLAVHAAVLQAGVFDPLRHFSFEAERGLESTSPMLPAAGAEGDETRLQSMRVEACFRPPETSTGKVLAISNFGDVRLEGETGAEGFGLPDVAEKSGVLWRVPKGGTFLMTGGLDAVVPMSR